MPRLSIIIPVYNEAATIAEVIRQVQNTRLPTGWKKEIIVIDDNSSDATTDILRKLTSDVFLIFKEKNEGKGSALKRGFREVTGDYVVIQDADLEYNPSDYSLLLQPIINNRSKIVFGSRIIKKSNKPSSKIFLLGGFFLTRIFNRLFNTKLTDITTCYKVFPKHFINKLIYLPSNDFVFDGVELTHALAAGNKIIEVPIDYQGRNKSEGKKVRWSDGIKFLLAMLRIKYDFDGFIRKLRFRVVLKLIKKGKVVADIGCGSPPFFLNAVQDQIKFGYGVDQKAKIFNNSKIKIANIDFDKAGSLPFENNFLDQVFILATVEHLEYPQLILKKIHHSLRDGGEIIITTPTKIAKPVLEFLAFKLRLINEADIRDHKYYFSKKKLVHLLQDAGFKEIKHKYFELGFNQLIIAKK